MKHTLVICVFILSCFVISNSFAGTWHNSTIKSVYPLANGNFILTLAEDSQQCASTNTPHYYYVEVGEHSITAEAALKIYSAALTAAASGKSVDFYFDESSPKCNINRVRVLF